MLSYMHQKLGVVLLTMLVTASAAWAYGDGIRNFSARRLAREKIQVRVDYTYTGDWGRSQRGDTHLIFMGAHLIAADGRELGAYRPVYVWEGNGTVYIEISMYRGDRLTTTAVKVFMFHASRGTIHSETFRHIVHWN